MRGSFAFLVPALLIIGVALARQVPQASIDVIDKGWCLNAVLRLYALFPGCRGSSMYVCKTLSPSVRGQEKQALTQYSHDGEGWAVV